MLVVTLGAFAYYTLWVIVVPFIDDDHVVQQFFPDPYFALVMPFTVLVVTVVVVGAFLALVMTHHKKVDKNSRRLRAPPSKNQ